MLFSEIYGSYYAAVARILEEAATAPVTRERMTELVRRQAFAESALSIPRALDSGSWPLLDKSGRSVLQNPPTMPVTTLEKRWLKALLLDPRIALFDPDPGGLEDVEPLFSPEDFVYFDRCGDGDPFQDPDYIQIFRTVLRAIREQRMLRIRFRSRDRSRHSVLCAPRLLEYSPKDDKFRLLADRRGGTHIINLGRIRTCQLLEEAAPPASGPALKPPLELTLLLRDERNALSRVLLHFSHLEKETRRLSQGVYQLRLWYDPQDETELLIRVLSFGPVLEVQGPERFRNLVRERIRNQAALFRGTEDQ